MNCKEFLHQLSTDPYYKDASFRDHARICPQCARVAQEALQFEQDLRAALTADVASAEARDSRSWKAPRARIRFGLYSFSLLVAALWLIYNVDLVPDSGRDLAKMVIAHIRTEEQHLRKTEKVSASRLRLLFRSFGAEVDTTLGPVSFADRCIIGEGEGIHLVLSGERGTVTALFLPEAHVSEEQDITDSGFAGAVLPTDWGALAIVGKPGEPVQPKAHRLLVGVHWANRDRSASFSPPRAPRR